MKLSNLLYHKGGVVNSMHSISAIDLAQELGFWTQSSAGVYNLLSFGKKLETKLCSLIRAQMEDIGFSEVELCLLQDLKIWQRSGRDKLYEGELFCINGRDKKQFALSATAEEVATLSVAKYESGRAAIDMHIYQIGKKFRDELRARGAMVRGKEFTMKDAYSFCSSHEGIEAKYEAVKGAYEALFKKLGLDASIEDADCGEVGGLKSQEFIVNSELGDANNKLEIAHIFDLGQVYTQKLDFYTNSNKSTHAWGACFGIGVSRLLVHLLERQKDKHGFFGTEHINTFDTVVSAIGWDVDQSVREKSLEIYNDLKAKGVDVLLDDSALRAGRKLTFSESIGVKSRVVVSHSSIASGRFEVLDRKSMSKTEVAQCDILNALATK